MEAVIQLQNVTKKFKDFTAVDQLSLEVKRGDIYGFLGPNGSGKSTTLRMIMSLIKPTSGEILIFGNSLHVQRSASLRKIGCIIEKPDFYTYLSAKENISLFVRAHGLHFKAKDYEALFEKVGLLGRENDKVKTFSHGMKQRLGLAQALLHNPELIILDEPNTGLDPQGIIDLRHLILQLNKEQGKTILFSSHILSEVQEVCNTMVVINNGKVVVQGNVSDLLSQENLQVSLNVIDGEHCASILSTSSWCHKIKQRDGNEFLFAMGKHEIPEMVTFLTQHQVSIERVDHRNQLEDYFLKITHQ